MLLKPTHIILSLIHISIQILWIAIAIGLYPLVKTGLMDLIHERKVGTEIFVTIATPVSYTHLCLCYVIRHRS